MRALVVGMIGLFGAGAALADPPSEALGYQPYTGQVTAQSSATPAESSSAPLGYAAPGSTTAAMPAADGSVVTLSAADREAVLDRAAQDNASLALNGDKRRIHGEVGMEVGTGGHRAIWGSTTVPLGDAGSATIAFMNSQGRDWRIR